MDEGVMGGLARAVRSDVLREPFGTSWLSHPNLWFFLQALSLRFFGESVSGLRTLSALLGTLTVPALYLLGRSLWGRTPAALAALLLLGSDHAVHFSRLALNNVADPLGATVYLAALTGGLRTGSPLLFAVAGVTLGTVLHCYFGSRLLLVLTALLGLHALLTRPRQLLRFRGHLVLLTLGFFLAWAPLLQHYCLHRGTWSERFRAVSIFTCPWDALRPLMERPLGERLLFNLPNSLGAFTHVPPNVYYDQQYNSRRALLNPAAAALLSLGFALACARIRRIRGFLPLAWTLSTAVFGGLLLAEPSPPYSNARYGIALPALCLLVAWGVERTAALLDPAPAPGRSGRILVAAALAALLAGLDADFYFRDFVRREDYAWADASNGVGRALAEHPDRNRLYVYFFSEPRTLYGNEARVFLAPDVPGTDLPRSPGFPPTLPPLPEGRRPMFFFLAGREGDLNAVRVLYPEGRVTERRGGDGRLIYLAYEPERSGRTPAPRDGKGAGRGKTGGALAPGRRAGARRGTGESPAPRPRAPAPTGRFERTPTRRRFGAPAPAGPGRRRRGGPPTATAPTRPPPPRRSPGPPIPPARV
jgi:hypothetical protein